MTVAVQTHNTTVLGFHMVNEMSLQKNKFAKKKRVMVCTIIYKINESLSLVKLMIFFNEFLKYL